MENFFSRYKNPLVLMLVLFIQVVGLATQVKRAESNKPSGGGGGPRLIRVWTVSIITPFEKAASATGHFFRHAWSNYIDLHGARKESRELQEQLARMKMEQIRLREEAGQVKRLQALLDFKEHYIGQTLAAQVIGTSGSEQSRVIYIDKGSKNSTGLKPDLPVITPDGVVGKVKEVFPFTSQVLLINDHESGAGVLLEDTRLQGVLRGTSQGQLLVDHVMSDEEIKTGEHIVTSGGDRIYPKGVPVGVVISSAKDPETDPFLKIRVKPAANLDKLEEVLVITRMAEEAPSATADSGPQRAADILSQRLPSAKQPDAKNASKGPAATPAPVPSGTAPARLDEKKAAAPAGEKKSAAPVTAPAPSGEKKTASPAASPKASDQKASVQKAGEQQKKPAVSGQASPTSVTPQPGLEKKKPAGDQKKATTPGAAAAGTPATKAPPPGPATKKPATEQKKAQAPGAAAAGSPATESSTAGSPTTKKATKPPVAKPKPTSGATGQTAPQATPSTTPESKKPEPGAQPTPPPGGERPQQ